MSLQKKSLQVIVNFKVINILIYLENLDWAMVDEDSNESYDAENESSDLSD